MPATSLITLRITKRLLTAQMAVRGLAAERAGFLVQWPHQPVAHS
ncbi:hypothetical protein [Polaromonas sp. UC242_47]